MVEDFHSSPAAAGMTPSVTCSIDVSELIISSHTIAAEACSSDPSAYCPVENGTIDVLPGSSVGLKVSPQIVEALPSSSSPPECGSSLGLFPTGRFQSSASASAPSSFSCMPEICTMSLDAGTNIPCLESVATPGCFLHMPIPPSPPLDSTVSETEFGNDIIDFTALTNEKRDTAACDSPPVLPMTGVEEPMLVSSTGGELASNLISDSINQGEHPYAGSEIPGTRDTEERRGGQCGNKAIAFGQADLEPVMQCRAGNPKCTLWTGRGALPESIGILHCDICCAEPRFCQDCICILCGKTIDCDEEYEYTYIRCFARLSEAGVCGHVAHLSCALACQLAGVVKQIGIDMEYICRRCDRKTDLRGHVVGLFGSLKYTKAKAVSESNLRLALQIMQGTELGGEWSSKLQRLAQTAIEMVQQGSNTEEVSDMLISQGLAGISGEETCLVDLAPDLCNRVSHTVMLPTLSVSPFANAMPELADGNAHVAILVGQSDTVMLDHNCFSSQVKLDRQSTSPDVSVSPQIGINMVQDTNCLSTCPTAPLQLLASGFEQEIHAALERLQQAQREEYNLAQKRLNTQKEVVLSLYEQLDIARHELQGRASASPLDSVDALMEQISNILDELQNESRVFKSMLGISEACGRTSKVTLEENFGLPVGLGET